MKRRTSSITETSKEQPSAREGKFQIGESGGLIQDDFCIFSHEAHIHEYVDYQVFMVSLSYFYTFLTIGCVCPVSFLHLMEPNSSQPHPLRLARTPSPFSAPDRFSPPRPGRPAVSAPAYVLCGYAPIGSSRFGRSLQCSHASPHAARCFYRWSLSHPRRGRR